MLTVTATYLLSEEGRKASLLDGGDGKAVQQLSLQVPANRLHLVSVDAHGVARLKLRPRYQLDGDNGIVRIDTAPTYDKSPDVEELFREAARNHQLEGAYRAERHTAKIKRREADQDRRANIAKAFLADPTRRALGIPRRRPSDASSKRRTDGSSSTRTRTPLRPRTFRRKHIAGSATIYA
jgi:hypothetical protein